MGSSLPRTLVLPVTGDILVTRVAGHYNIGRVAADGSALAIDSRNDRAEALTFACKLVTAGQRVILYHQADSSARLEIHCPKSLRAITPTVA